MQLINLTPHAINVYDGETKQPLMTIQPSGTIARVSVKTEKTCQYILGIPIVDTIYGELEGIPTSYESDTFFIVSALVKNAMKEKGLFTNTKPWSFQTENFLFPSDQIRNEEGQVIGCTSLSI